eukprot:485329-Pleurochrysis_carterae.AAC.1
MRPRRANSKSSIVDAGVRTYARARANSHATCVEMTGGSAICKHMDTACLARCMAASLRAVLACLRLQRTRRGAADMQPNTYAR